MSTQNIVVEIGDPAQRTIRNSTIKRNILFIVRERNGGRKGETAVCWPGQPPAPCSSPRLNKFGLQTPPKPLSYSSPGSTTFFQLY